MGYKATPVTYKAASAVKANRSALKADAALIQGAADIGDSKKFVDHSASVEKSFEGVGGNKGAKGGGSAGQADGAVTPPDADDAAPPSPAKLDPMTIMKIASMAGGGKKKSGGGGGTTVVVQAPQSKSIPDSGPAPSQAGDAVEPK